MRTFSNLLHLQFCDSFSGNLRDMGLKVIIFSTNVVANLLLYLLLFCKSQNQESIFREVGGLITSTISGFCL